MKRRIVIYLLLNLLFGQFAFAAEMTGRVIDAYTTEALVGVNILVVGTSQGTFTDPDGQFRLIVLENADSLRFSMLGYETHYTQFRQTATPLPKLLVRLRPVTLDLGEQISVVGKFPTLNKSTEVSTQRFESRELADISGTVDDLTRTIQTLPGVVAQADFSGKMYVRGGKAEENLVMLDRTFIYDPYHIAGLVSIFNPDLIDDVEFYAGGFPAKYGQAMSSVLEVQNKTGSRDRFKGSLSLDVISAKTLMSGKLPGSKGSWILSGRRSYQDKLMRALGEFEDHILPSFYDYQTKLFYPLTERHLLTANALLSGDYMDIEVSNPDSVLDAITSDGGRFFWDNGLTMFSLDWKFLISPHVFTHSTASVVTHDFESRTSGADPDWGIGTATHYDFREDATILSIPGHKIETGLYLFRSNADIDLRWKQSIFLENINENSSTGFGSARFKTKFARVYHYAGVYVQDTWDFLQPQFSLSYGLRSDYLKNTSDFKLSPRLNVVYRFDELTMLKAAWGMFHQVPRDPVQTDDDIGNPDLKSQKAVHYVAGLERRLSENMKGRIEFFYKDLSSLIVNVEDTLINFANSGRGESYGFELFTQKRLSGRLDGWLSYTYSISNRQDRPDGVKYHPLQDQRHTLSLVMNYRLNSHWRLSFKGSFYTGKPYTPVLSAEPLIHPISGNIIRDPTSGFPIYAPLEGEINSARFPAYHRLDLRIDYDFKFKGYSMSLYFEILNVYDHHNIFDYNYKHDYSDRKAVSQFPLLPTTGIRIGF